MSDNDLSDRQLELLASARRKDDPVVVEAAEAKQVDDAEALLEEADGVADPTVVESEDAEALENAEALLEEADGVDDPTVVSESEYEQQQDALEAVEEFLGDALTTQYGLREGVVDAMSASAMIEQFRDDEDEFDLEALTQQPQTGGADGTDDGGSDDTGGAGGDGFDVDALNADERQEVDDLLRRADLMSGRTPEHAESLREEAADIAGVEDADAIEREVL